MKWIVPWGSDSSFGALPGSQSFYWSPDREISKATESVTGTWFPCPLPLVTLNVPMPSSLGNGGLRECVGWVHVALAFDWERASESSCLRVAAGSGLERPPPVSSSPRSAANKLQQWKKMLSHVNKTRALFFFLFFFWKHRFLKG